MAETTPDWTEQEELETLKRMARESTNEAARIAAIKLLRENRRGAKPAEDGFAQLYALPARRSGSG